MGGVRGHTALQAQGFYSSQSQSCSCLLHRPVSAQNHSQERINVLLLGNLSEAVPKTFLSLCQTCPTLLRKLLFTC